MRNETYKPHVNQIVGRHFIKLINLQHLISSVYAGCGATEVNFCIDLYSIKNRLLGKDFAYDTEVDLCSIVLDMIVYYKSYFRSIGVLAYFYLFDSNNLPPYNKSILPMYNSEYAIKLTSGNAEYIDKNYAMLNTISGYLPEIYYLRSESEVAVMIYDEFVNSGIPTMVLSTDPYMYLLAAETNMSWLRPKKIRTGSSVSDASYIVTRGNVWSVLMAYMKNNINVDISVLPETNLRMALACTKFPARSMRPMLQMRTIKNVLGNMSQIFDLLASRLSEADIEEIQNRSKTLNIPLQVDLYRQTSSYVLNKNRAPKLYDIEALKHLNNEYFSGNPLQLDELLR